MVVGELIMKHFGLGLIVGLVFFLGPGLITDNGGLLGSELFEGLLALGIVGVILLGILYSAIGGIVFGFIIKLKASQEIFKKSMIFSSGILLAYLIFWIVGIFAFSNFGF